MTGCGATALKDRDWATASVGCAGERSPSGRPGPGAGHRGHADPNPLLGDDDGGNARALGAVTAWDGVLLLKGRPDSYADETMCPNGQRTTTCQSPDEWPSR